MKLKEKMQIRLDRRHILGMVAAAVAFLYGLMLVLFLFLPFASVSGGARDEAYTVEWENGETTSEPFAALYSDLTGLRDGKALLCRSGIYGTCSSEGIAEIESVVRDGSLLELTSLDMGASDRLTRIAVVREYAKTVWMSNGESFSLGADGFRKTTLTTAHTLVLLSGSVSAQMLFRADIREFWLHGEAEFSSDTLVGTNIEAVRAFSPYSEQGGAVYLQTPGGRRLMAAVPVATELTVTGNDYADSGALRACTRLESLTLDFVGNGKNSAMSEFDGFLGYLFSDGTDYFIPETLASLTVKGGVLVSNAFYRCRSLKEINACGVDPAKIAPAAFIDLSLESLHTPRSDVILNGRYSSVPAACGCTVFKKI